MKLDALKEIKKGELIDINLLAEKLEINVDKLRGIIEELKRKNYLSLETREKRRIYLGDIIKKYGEPPEAAILKRIIKDKKLEFEELKKKVKLSLEDFNAGISILIREGLIRIQKEDGKTKVILKNEAGAKEYLEKIGRIFEYLSKNEGIEYGSFLDQFRDLSDLIAKLIKRPGLMAMKTLKITYVKFNTDPRKLESELTRDYIKDLTRDIIISGVWKKKKFKRYNVLEEGYSLFPGRRHPISDLIKEIREVFFEMGFEEVDGPLVETAFVNFDMLFQPQDHPARDMQDTFYLKEPFKYGDLPFPELVDKIKAVHENGGETGSIGWRYKWSVEEARKLVLRTHTTAVTIRNLYVNRKAETLKLFSIGRVFRNETIDYKHLSDFTQVDGILMNKKANLRLLMGILEYFFKRMGAEKIRFWPTYFPFTEPSVQPTIYSSKIGEWIELGGAGIFRPEITQPMGIEQPVLAWGLGLERIIMIKYDLEDIRDIYFNKLSWLRNRGV